MNKPEKKEDRTGLIIGGMTCVGIGVGFVFLRTSALLFVACILMGIGVGLVIASIFAGKKG